jgi:hypothetical protein
MESLPFVMGTELPSMAVATDRSSYSANFRSSAHAGVPGSLGARLGLECPCPQPCTLGGSTVHAPRHSALVYRVRELVHTWRIYLSPSPEHRRGIKEPVDEWL